MLEPGEMVMFPNSIVHGSSINLGPDRRFLLLVEMVPIWAERPRGRESAMLVRGDGHLRSLRRRAAARRRVHANGPGELAARGRVAGEALFSDSRYAPSEAYGGQRSAT